MDWLTRYAFLFVLILSQRNSAFGGSISSEEISSRPNSAQTFATSFVNYIVASGVFPEQEEEDMKEFIETLSMAVTSLTNNKWASRAKIEALSMAFASAMAELIVIEDDDGENVSTDVKVKVISDGLGQAFKETTGSVNEGFIEEIQELLGMFAHAVVSGINEADSTAAYLPSEPEHNAKLAKAFEFASGTGAASTDKETTSQQVTSASSSFIEQLYNALINDSGFQSAFSGTVSTNIINAFATAIAGSVASASEFSSVGYSSLVKAYLQALSSEKDGATIEDYARAIATATSNVLEQNGIFSEGVASGHITAAVNAITSGISSTHITESAVTTTSVGSQTTVSSDAGTSSGVGHIPAYTAPAGTPAVAINFARQIYISLLADPSFSSVFQAPISLDRVKIYLAALAKFIVAIPRYSIVSADELVNGYLGTIIGIPPGSASSIYAQAIARITADTFYKNGLLSLDTVNAESGIIQNAVQNALRSAALESSAITSGTEQTSADQKPISEHTIDDHPYIAPEGTPAVSVAFAKRIYLALATDKRFVAAFTEPLSLTRARIYLSALAKSLCALPRYNTISDEELVEGYIEAISAVQTAPNPELYAQEIATVTALIFYENNLLTWQALTAGSAALQGAIQSALNAAAEEDTLAFSATVAQTSTTQISSESQTSAVSDSTTLTAYNPPVGSTPVARNFGRLIYNSLLADEKFSSVFGIGNSFVNIRLFLTTLATSICSFPQFSSVTVSELVGKYIQAITPIPQGSDIHQYAQAIAQATAEIMSSRKLLSLQGVTALSSSLESAISSALESSSKSTSVTQKSSSEIITTATAESGETTEITFSSFVKQSGIASKFASSLYNSLLSNELFQAIFSHIQNTEHLDSYGKALIKNVFSLGNINVSELSDNLLKAFQTIPLGSSLSQYAQVIVNTVAEAFIKHEVLIPGNEESLAASTLNVLISGLREQSEEEAAQVSISKATAAIPVVAKVETAERPYSAPPGSDPSVSSFGRKIYDTLLNDPTFSIVFGADISTENVEAYLNEIVESILGSPEFQSLNPEELLRAYLKSLANIADNASIYDYAQLLAEVTAEVLYAAHLLDDNYAEQASAATDAISKGLNKVRASSLTETTQTDTSDTDEESKQSALAVYRPYQPPQGFPEIAANFARELYNHLVSDEKFTTNFKNGVTLFAAKDYLSKFAVSIESSYPSITPDELNSAFRSALSALSETSDLYDLAALISNITSETLLKYHAISVDSYSSDTQTVLKASKEGLAQTISTVQQTLSETEQEVGYQAAVGTASFAADFGRQIYNALLSNTRFTDAFTGDITLLRIRPFFTVLAENIIAIPQFSSLTLNDLVDPYISAVLQISPGSPLRIYAQEIARLTVNILLSKNLLTSEAASLAGTSIQSAIAGTVQTSSRTRTETSTTTSALETAESESQLVLSGKDDIAARYIATAGAPEIVSEFAAQIYEAILGNPRFALAFDGEISLVRIRPFLTTLATRITSIPAFSSLLVSTLVNQYITGVLRINAGSPLTLYAKTIADITAELLYENNLLTQDSLASSISSIRTAATTSSTDQEAVTTTTEGSESSSQDQLNSDTEEIGYTARAGATILESALGEKFYRALISNAEFRQAFAGEILIERLRPFLNALARQIIAIPQFSSLQLDNLVGPYIEAVLSIRSGSPLSFYAERIAQTTARLLYSRNLLTLQLVDNLDNAIETAVSTAISEAQLSTTAGKLEKEEISSVTTEEKTGVTTQEDDQEREKEETQEAKEGFGYQAAAGTSVFAADFGRQIYEALLSNPKFAEAFTGAITILRIRPFFTVLAENIIAIPVFSSLTLNELVDPYISAVLRIERGSSLRAYAQEIAGLTVEILLSRNLLTAEAASLARTSVQSAISTALESTSTTTETSTTSAVATAESEGVVAAGAEEGVATGFVARAGAPAIVSELAEQIYVALLRNPAFSLAFGGEISLETFRSFLTTFATRITSIPAFSSLLVSTLVDQNVAAVLRISAGSPLTFYAKVIAEDTAQLLYENNLLTQHSLAAASSAVQTAATEATAEAEIITTTTEVAETSSAALATSETEAVGYTAGEGATALESAFGEKLYNALITNVGFRQAFSGEILILNIRPFLNSLATQIIAIPQFSSLQLDDLVRLYIEAVLSISAGSPLRLYAERIGQTTARLLYSRNLLTLQLVYSLDSAIETAVSTAISESALSRSADETAQVESSTVTVEQSTAITTQEEAQETEEEEAQEEAELEAEAAELETEQGLFEPSEIFEAPDGLTPSEVLFARTLYYNTLQSTAFQTTFSSGVSQETAIEVLTRIASSLSLVPDFRRVRAAKFAVAYRSALSSLPNEATLSSYAKILADVTTLVLAKYSLIQEGSETNQAALAVSALNTGIEKARADGIITAREETLKETETISTSTSALETGTATEESVSETEEDVGFQAAAGTSSYAAEFGREIYNVLLSNPRFTETFAGEITLLRIKPFFTVLAENIIAIPVFSSLTLNDLVDPYISAVLRIEPGSSLRAYAQEIAGLTVEILLSTNLLTAEAASLARISVQSAISTALESTSTTTGTSTISAVETAESESGLAAGEEEGVATGFVARAGAPAIVSELAEQLYVALLRNPAFSLAFGGEISLETFRTFLTTFATRITSIPAFSSLLASTLVDQNVAAVLRLSAGSPLTLYAKVIAEDTAQLLYENNLLTQQSLAESSSAIHTAATEATAEGKSITSTTEVVETYSTALATSETEVVGYTAGEGAAALESTFGEKLYNALITNVGFRQAFSGEILILNIRPFLNSLATQIIAIPQFSSLQLDDMLRLYIEAVLSISAGSPLRLYAERIAQTTARLLYSRNLLTLQLVYSLDSAIETAVSIAISESALSRSADETAQVESSTVTVEQSTAITTQEEAQETEEEEAQEEAELEAEAAELETEQGLFETSEIFEAPDGLTPSEVLFARTLYYNTLQSTAFQTTFSSGVSQETAREVLTRIASSLSLVPDFRRVRAAKFAVAYRSALSSLPNEATLSTYAKILADVTTLVLAKYSLIQEGRETNQAALAVSALNTGIENARADGIITAREETLKETDTISTSTSALETATATISLSLVPQFSRVRPVKFTVAYRTALSSLSDDGTLSGFAKVFADGTTLVLANYGLIEEGNEANLATLAVSALSSGIEKARAEGIFTEVSETESTAEETESISTTTSALETAAATEESVSETEEDVGFQAAAGTSSYAAEFGRQIYDALLSNPRFTETFAGEITLLRIRPFFTVLAENIIAIPVFSSLTLNDLVDPYISAVLRIERGSSLRAYAQEIAGLTVEILLSRNLLTAEAASLARTSVQRAISTALESTSTRTETSTTTAVETAESESGLAAGEEEGVATGFVARAGAPAIVSELAEQIYVALLRNPAFSLAFGGEISLETFRPFLTTFATRITSIPAFSSLLVSTLVDQNVAAVLRITAGSPVTLYAKVIAEDTAQLLYENNLLTQQSLAASSSAIQTAAKEATAVAETITTTTEVSETASAALATSESEAVGYTAAEGATAVESALGEKLYNALIRNAGFRLAFTGEILIQNIRPFLTALATQIIAIPQFSSLQLEDLVGLYIEAVLSVSAGSPLRLYAERIAQTTARLLFSRNLLTLQLVESLDSAIATAVSTAISEAEISATAEEEESAVVTTEEATGITTQEETLEEEEAEEEAELEAQAAELQAQAYVAPDGLTVSQILFARALYLNLLQDATFRSSFSAGVSEDAAREVFSRAAISLSLVPQFSRVRPVKFTVAYRTALSSLSDDGTLSGFAKVFADGTTLVLANYGLIEEGNEANLATLAVSALSSGIEKARAEGIFTEVSETESTAEETESISTTTSALETAAATEESVSETDENVGFQAAAGTTSYAAEFGRQIYDALLSNPRFTETFAGEITLLRIRPFFTVLAENIIAIPVFSSLTLNDLVDPYISAVLRIERGSSLRAYAQEIAGLTVEILLSRNLLTAEAASLARTSVQRAISTALESTSTRTETSTTTAVETAESESGLAAGEEEGVATGFVARAGAPAIVSELAEQIYVALLRNPAFSLAFGGEISLETFRPFLTTFATRITSIPAFSSLLVSTLVDQNVAAVLRITAGSPVTLYAKVIAEDTAQLLYENNLLTQQSLAASSSAIQTAAKEATAVAETITTTTEVSETASAALATSESEAVGYTAAEGATAVESALGEKLYNALIRNAGFRLAFTGEILIQNIRPFLTALATQIIAIPQFSSLQLEDLVGLYIEAVLSVSAGSPLRLYAERIAQTTARLLFSRNLLTLQLVESLDSAIATAVSTAISEAEISATAEEEESAVVTTEEATGITTQEETLEEEEAEEEAELEAQAAELQAQAYVAPDGLTVSQILFARALYLNLLQDATFRSSFSAGVSEDAAREVFSRAAISLSLVPQFSRVRPVKFTVAYRTALSSLSDDGTLSGFAKVFADGTTLVLANYGLIEEGNEANLATLAVSALSSGIEKARAEGIFTEVSETESTAEETESISTTTSALETAAATEESVSETEEDVGFKAAAGTSSYAAEFGRQMYDALLSNPRFTETFAGEITL
ncbi:hypothetical protein X975_03452, partial [Stegodyphus mimosarum]